MSRLWYTSCIVIVAMTAFGAPQGDDPVYKEVIVYPNAKKNKAFPLKAGSASFCDLKLRPETPWRIRKSDIAPSDDKIFWYKISDAEYGLAYAYADKEYAVINGDLYKPGNGGGGKGNPAYPPFTVTVPEVNLQWGADHGDASKEEKEDTVPAVLVVSESKNLFGRLLVHPPKDDFSIETRKCRVTLLWSPADAVKVFKDGTEIGTKTAFDFDSSDAKPVELDVCAVKSAVDVKFTLEGEPDNVNKDRAVDYVHAKCVTLNFEVKSVAEMPYDDIDDGTLIDSRYATIEVTTDPKGVDVSDLGITFSAVTAEKGDLINHDNHDNKFDVEIEHKAGNLWKTKDKVLWYGVKPDRECWFYSHAYVFSLKCHGDEVVSKKYKVRWPETRYWAHPGVMTVNHTVPMQAVPYESMKEKYYYCKIDFKCFKKERGLIYSKPSATGRLFDCTSQYRAEIEKEENFHLDQFLGAVPRSQGGLDDCYTTNGIKYFISQQAKKNEHIAVSTWIVTGSTPSVAKALAEEVIRVAISQEIVESLYIETNEQRKAFSEFKAKEHAGYNAAWRYHHCTYRDCPKDPICSPVHKAYQGK